jgi:hypothetical protein
MLSCWNASPRLRPTFADLMLSLANQPTSSHRHGARRHTSNHLGPVDVHMQASKSHVFDSTSPRPALDVPTQSQSQGMGRAATVSHASRSVQPASHMNNIDLTDPKSGLIPTMDGNHRADGDPVLPNAVHVRDRHVDRETLNHAAAGLPSFASFSRQQQQYEMDDDL